MEIVMTQMSSLSKMPQAFTEITAADEAGGIQGKGAQSPSFGLLFDQWAGMAEGERLPGDSGSNEFSQLPLREESPAEIATGGAQRNDPSQGPLLRVTDTFTAGQFTMAAAAPDRTVQQLPEQTAADSGASDTGKEVNSAAVPTPGENGVPATSTLQMLPGLQQKIGQGGNTGEITTETFGKLRSERVRKVQIPSENPSAPNTTVGLPILAKSRDHSTDSPPAEKPHETGEEKMGTDSVWAPLLAVGNLLSEGDFATPLSESAGPVQQQGNAQPENDAGQSLMQPDNLLQEVGGITGYILKDPATLLPANASDSLLASESSSRAFILKGAELSHDSLPGFEAPPGNFGKVTGSAMKTGADAVIPQAKGDFQAGLDILFSRKNGMNSEAVDISCPEADLSFREAAPASVTQSRTSSESAGNAYRAVAADTVMFGKNDVSSIPGNVTQGKPLANQELSAANTGMDLSRMEIVFAAAEQENLKEPGGDVTRKSGEGKIADNASTMASVANQAELRIPGEGRLATQSPDAKNPLGEHITNQIRENLDAGGHGSDKGQITLKLHPEELGELKINMRMEDQRLKVEIVTDNQSVKDALMQNLDTLKETLSRQNIAMDHFNVSADLRQGFQQGARDGKQMVQDNRGTDAGFRPAAATEEDSVTNLRYPWENENSLVNLVL
jgi:flagellar hook-length control protein FliK